jgi:hypothetical protein
MHRILFLPDIRPDIRLIQKPNIGYPAGYPPDQFGIRPDTGNKKRPDYPAGYPVHP